MDPKIPSQRFCPRCGSTELEEFMGMQAGYQFKCRKCGFVGVPMEGDAKFISNFKAKLNEEKH
ncbi:MAG: hypothetical protein ABIA76_05750 [Candidatus Diapherotrites archaeon]